MTCLIRWFRNNLLAAYAFLVVLLAAGVGAAILVEELNATRVLLDDTRRKLADVESNFRWLEQEVKWIEEENRKMAEEVNRLPKPAR